MRTSSLLLLFATLAIGVVLVGLSAYTYYEYYWTPRCTVCGMVLTPEMLDQWQITVPKGEGIHACCPGCALRLASLEACSTIHIETYDDWYGPTAKIVIDISNRTIESVSPTTVRFLMGSKVVKSCANNRIAVNQTSIELLLANGYNPENPHRAFSNPLPAGTPVVESAKALASAVATGISYSPPGTFFLAGTAGAGIAVLMLSALFTLKVLRKSRQR